MDSGSELLEMKPWNSQPHKESSYEYYLLVNLETHLLYNSRKQKTHQAHGPANSQGEKNLSKPGQVILPVATIEVGFEN